MITKTPQPESRQLFLYTLISPEFIEGKRRTPVVVRPWLAKVLRELNTYIHLMNDKISLARINEGLPFSEGGFKLWSVGSSLAPGRFNLNSDFVLRTQHRWYSGPWRWLSTRRAFDGGGHTMAGSYAFETLTSALAGDGLPWDSEFQVTGDVVTSCGKMFSPAMLIDVEEDRRRAVAEEITSNMLNDKAVTFESIECPELVKAFNDALDARGQLFIDLATDAEPPVTMSKDITPKPWGRR